MSKFGVTLGEVLLSFTGTNAVPSSPHHRLARPTRVWLVGASSGIGRRGRVAAARPWRAGVRVGASAGLARCLRARAPRQPGAGVGCDRRAGRRRQRALLAGGPLDLVCYCAGHYRPMSAHALDLPELLQHQQRQRHGRAAGAGRRGTRAAPSAGAGRTPHLSLVASVAAGAACPKPGLWPTKAALINLAENLFLICARRGGRERGQPWLSSIPR